MSRSAPSLAARRGPAPWPLLAIALAACAPAVQTGGEAAGPAEPASAATLVARMHEAWAGRFYETLVFRQQNTTYTSAGEQTSEWLEHQRVPGLLRIDFMAPAANGSGVIYRADSAYAFDAGTLQRQAPQLHPLLLLAADVYAQPVEATLADLARLRIDTAVFRRDTWAGRAVYVVGAAAGDSTTNQFWIDAERLLLVRLIHAPPRVAQATPPATDYQLTYQTVDGFAIPQEILFRRNGRTIFRETYLDPRPNAPVDDALFDPARWAQGVPPR